jgi:hypothetical protein
LILKKASPGLSSGICSTGARRVRPVLSPGFPFLKSTQFEVTNRMTANIALTYANDQENDGAGAQLQRIYGIYAISRFFKLPYVHSPLRTIGYHGLAALEKNSAVPDLESRYNRVFEIPSDLELPERRVVHDMRDADAAQILKLRDSGQKTGEFHLVRILFPYPITDKIPETYRHVKAISPFRAIRSDVFRLAIHVRRGEIFMFASDRMLPNAYYVSCALKAVECLQKLDIPFVVELYTEVPTKKFVVTPKHHWVEGHIHNDATLDPEQNHLEDFDVIPNLVPFINGDPIETLGRMATADGLILSHSSFSYVAAILSRKGIVLYNPFWHYPMNEWLNTEADGAFQQLEFMKRLEAWRENTVLQEQHRR